MSQLWSHSGFQEHREQPWLTNRLARDMSKKASKSIKEKLARLEVGRQGSHLDIHDMGKQR